MYYGVGRCQAEKTINAKKSGFKKEDGCKPLTINTQDVLKT